MIGITIGIVVFFCWIYLLFFNGFFWRERPAFPPPETGIFPFVVAVVPARNESETIFRAIQSLLLQDYPGKLHVILVDDHSSDGTAALARSAARGLQREDRLTIVAASPLPPGWSGKVWAMHSGVEAAKRLEQVPEFLLFTDGDIHHPAGNLRHLVSRALGNPTLGLVSLMARLNCSSFAEKLMIPAFVFFFAMLYPFRRVNDPTRKVAGAAGGVLLVRRSTLEQAGGLVAIRKELIDDCALAALVKRHAGIWLGLSDDTLSLRRYRDLSAIWRMVARTAFSQLDYSVWRLSGALAGLAVAYFAPPLLLLSGSLPAAALGAASWIAMAVAFWNTIRFYHLNPAWSLTLPLTALIYA